MGERSRRWTRLHFHRSVAVGVASAPSVIPRTALGSEDRDAPSKRITIGFIGTGKMNRHHLNHFLNKQDVQVLAVCDVDTTRRDHARRTVDRHYGKKAAATANGGCAAYVDFRDLLARDDIDAVVIATPDHWHASPVLEACRTGKDIYCEKPLSDWRAYREYSGGAMTDWGAHHFDIVQWGLDMDTSGPEKIVPPDDVPAQRGLRYVYASGVEMVHGPGEGVQFIGTDGQITVNRGHLSSKPQETIEEPLSDGDVKLRRSTGHARDWLNGIRTRERPICDVVIGARAVTVCHLGTLAYWNGRALHWDPQAWRFVNDSEANTWLDRQRREPWRLPAA